MESFYFVYHSSDEQVWVLQIESFIPQPQYVVFLLNEIFLKIYLSRGNPFKAKKDKIYVFTPMMNEM